MRVLHLEEGAGETREGELIPLRTDPSPTSWWLEKVCRSAPAPVDVLLPVKVTGQRPLGVLPCITCVTANLRNCCRRTTSRGCDLASWPSDPVFWGGLTCCRTDTYTVESSTIRSTSFGRRARRVVMLTNPSYLARVIYHSLPSSTTDSYIDTRHLGAETTLEVRTMDPKKSR